MLEIEVKYRVDDFAAVEAQLRQWNCAPGRTLTEVDSYLNAPDRDFAKTDEALRIRQIGDLNFITYKGPKLDQQTKTRAELELPLPEGETQALGFRRLFEHLGYRFVAQVKKTRSSYSISRAGFELEVCLDRVEDVGSFVELEIVAPEDSLEKAKATVLETAAELGLRDSERRSYLHLLLNARGGHGMKTAVAHTIVEVRQAVRHARGEGRRIGLVPTMGALHAGHMSLVEAAKKQADFVVLSIFVNPTQFGPSEDFSRYPRTLDSDLRLCSEAGVDVAFVPDVAEIYPKGACTVVEVLGLQDGLCGASRPGHFRGVATVVLKLFNIVQPDVACFGQKDAQQARILQQMTLDLNLPIHIEVCPIVREADGLALSSRNRYLSPQERQRALVLSAALVDAERAVVNGERDGRRLRSRIVDRIGNTEGVTLDYAEVVDADSLQQVTSIRGPVLIAVAARVGATRLIDNVIVQPGGSANEES